MTLDLLKKVARFKQLDKKKLNEHLSEKEEQEWMNLKNTLGQKLFGHASRPNMQERRQHLRVDANSTIAVDFPDAKGFERAFLRNISGGGLYVESDRNIRLGSSVKIQISVGTDNHLEIEGKVVWVNSAPTDRCAYKRGFGIKFENLSKENEEQINALVHQNLDATASKAQKKTKN